MALSQAGVSGSSVLPVIVPGAIKTQQAISKYLSVTGPVVRDSIINADDILIVLQCQFCYVINIGLQNTVVRSRPGIFVIDL